MEGIDIFNICCQSGSTTNDVVKETLQLSEHFLLHSSNINARDNSTRPEATRMDQMQELGKKKRSAWMFFVRDMIWKLTAFKWKKIIAVFIIRVNPDIIYLPIYASLYMCDIDNYVIKQLNVSVVGHNQMMFMGILLIFLDCLWRITTDINYAKRFVSSSVDVLIWRSLRKI